MSSPRAILGFGPLLAVCVVAASPSGAAPVSSPRAAMAAPDTKTPDAKAADAKWRQPLVGAPAALHVLNRLAFGPTPGQVEEVQKIGVHAWIEAQLQPNTIDDSALAAKLAGLQLLQSDPAALSLMYRGDNGAIARYVKLHSPDGGKGKKARLEAIAAPNMANGAMAPNPNDAPAAMMAPDANGAMMAPNPNGAVPAPPADAPKSRLDRVLDARQQETLDRFTAAGYEPGVSIVAAGELVQAKLARAVESKRQLQEVLADFWSNHFNIDMRQKGGRTFKIVDDRDAIRPHLFGSFRELLGASAHSPAMLVYLDNARSGKEVKARNGKTRGGLNENYGRELMELHTLGVDGGYTQTDVTEVARCLTGWSVDEDGKFLFRARAHDDGEKHVLGHTIAAGGGQSDGDQVLDILASSPATAKFLSRELCQRFVADDPPTSLVERVTATWIQTKGDLPSVYRAIFFSPEFSSAGAYRSKIKSPFEYTVSAVRALGGELNVPDASSPVEALRLRRIGALSANQNAQAGKRGAGARSLLAVELATLGQPVFACLPPTGWSEDSSQWVSAGAIIGRLNFALALTSGTIGDVRLSSDTFRAAPLDDLSKQLVGGQLSDPSRATITRETASNPNDGAKIRALILGAPEFQRR